MRVENRIDRGRYAELHEKAVAATSLLKDILGASADLVQVNWSLAFEAGPNGPRPVAQLELSDPFAGSKSATFASSEFDQLLHLRFRLYDIWGDLLQKRSQQNLEQLEASFAAAKEAEE